MENKSKTINIVIILALIAMLVLSILFDFRIIVESNSYLVVLKNNVLYFISVITKSIPIIVILLLLYVWRKFATKWIIKIEKLDVGGASIIFERPEELFKQQIKNFLNTKRSLFYFDAQRDNIYDCISSYYKIYTFIRENINLYDTKSSQKSKYYEISNDMLHTLNEFLTDHQSDYRRWFESNNESFSDEHRKCKSIAEIQKEYWNYSEIIKGFMNVNNSFNEYAIEFEIDTQKWEKVNGNSTL